MTRLIVIAALALAGFVAGCGSSEPVVPPSQIANAAYKSTHGSGYKYALTLDASAGGQDVSVTAHGVIDERAKRGMLTMDLEGSNIQVLLDDPYIYTRTDGGTWVRVKSNVYEQAQQSAGGVSGQATSDPSQIMKFLNSANSVKKVGTEDVNGTPTTHYLAQVDFQKRLKTVPQDQRDETEQFLKLLKASNGDTVLPVDVFIDDHKLVRRLGFKIDVCTTEGDVSIDLTFDFLRYGPQTIPGLPRGATVRDGTAEFKKKANSTDLSQYSC